MKKNNPIVKEIQLTDNNISFMYQWIHGSVTSDLNCNVAREKWEEYPEIVKANGLPLTAVKIGVLTPRAKVGEFIRKHSDGTFSSSLTKHI